MNLFHTLKRRRGRVLFVCLGNSYRSRMAEAFAKSFGSDIMEADSAGIAPARKSSRIAGRLMLEKGLELEDKSPRRFGESELAGFDLIVNLCEYGLSAKTRVPVVKIPFPDPIGKDEAQQRLIRDRIEMLVRLLVEQFRQARDEWNFGVPDSPVLLPAPRLHPRDAAMLSWWRQRGYQPASSVRLPHEGLPG